MSEVTQQTQIVREAPAIEAYKLGLLELAKERANIPVDVGDPRLAVQVADLSPQQRRAMEMYEAGLGSYRPYFDEAYSTIGEGVDTTRAGLTFADEAANLARLAPGTAGTAAAGITGIAQGLTGQTAYDPNQAQAFMDPYQQLVTRQAIAELDRAAAPQRQQIDDAALAAGAFGGSRRTLTQSEFERNLADIKSKRIAEDLSKNYMQALAGSMQADEAAKARELEAGRLGIGAYGQAGQLGLSGQELGLRGLQGIGSFYGQTGGQLGEMGIAQGRIGEALPALRGEEARLLSTLGGVAQQTDQARLDAARATAMQQAYEPFQRIGFLSDIYKGAPTSQSSFLRTTAPGTSALNQIIGSGVSALGAYKGYQSLFGKDDA